MCLLCSNTADFSPHSLRQPESFRDVAPRHGSVRLSHSPLLAAPCSSHTSPCHSLNVPTLFCSGLCTCCSLCLPFPSESCVPHCLVFQIYSHTVSSVSFLSPKTNTKLPAPAWLCVLMALPHDVAYCAVCSSLCFLSAPQLERTRNVSHAYLCILNSWNIVSAQ